MPRFIQLPQDLVTSLMNYLETCVETNKHSPDESSELLASLQERNQVPMMPFQERPAPPKPFQLHPWYRVLPSHLPSRFAGKTGKLVCLSGDYPDYFIYLQFESVTPGSLVAFFGSELEAVEAPQ